MRNIWIWAGRILLLAMLPVMSGGCSSNTVPAENFSAPLSEIGPLIPDDRNFYAAAGLLKKADPAKRALEALLSRRCAQGDDQIIRSDAALQEAQDELLQTVIASPNRENTFALAETIAQPEAPEQDIALAAVLYCYSAQRNFPAAAVRLAQIHQGNEISVNTGFDAGILPSEYSSDQYDSHLIPDVAQQLQKSADRALRRAVADYPLAVRLLLVARRNGFAPRSSEKVLLDLDRHYGLALLVIAWQQQKIKNVQDVFAQNLETDLLILSLRSGQRSAWALKELNDLLKQYPEKFYDSGVILRIPELFYNDRAALQSFFPAISQLPLRIRLAALLTQAVAAADLGEHNLMLENSAALLRTISQLPLPEPALDLRKTLMSVIPGAAALPSRTIDLPEEWKCLWNAAVLLRINALLANGQSDQAEEFADKYPRHELSGFCAELEKNFVRCHLRYLYNPAL